MARACADAFVGIRRLEYCGGGQTSGRSEFPDSLTPALKRGLPIPKMQRTMIGQLLFAESTRSPSNGGGARLMRALIQSLNGESMSVELAHELMGIRETNSPKCTVHRDSCDGCEYCPFYVVLPCLMKLQQISNHLKLIKPNPKDDMDQQKKDVEFSVAVLGSDIDHAGGNTQNESFMGLSDVKHCVKMLALEKFMLP